MLRGRIVAANGVQGRRAQAGRGAAWVLRGDRGITYAPTLPEARGWSTANGGGRTMPGRRWSRSSSKIADGLGLKLGDTITVNVLGRNVTARIANLRTRRLAKPRHQFRAGVFARHLRRRAAYRHRHADLRRRRQPPRRPRWSRRWPTPFPTVTAVRVKDALDTIDHLVGNLVLGLRGASAITLDRGRSGAGRRARRRPALSHLRCGRS